MNNIVIGTAGHVDHGKTHLIKALTGMDTDRLAEEKKRGITIELGFAHLPLPGGGEAGIVDVPGHERFIKNMLAGAGGMDLALLVVAADEGFMPQTREHLGILSLLGIPQGIVVLTKVDLVDEEWLEVVTDEVAQEVQGTFLEGAPILPVSSHTGVGLEELRQEIYRRVEGAKHKNTRAPFREPVDRVFTVDGFGTVVTGTLLEGEVAEGDEVMVYPSGLTAKVRGIQVHGQSVPVASAGQRTAINLTGIKRTDISRGDTLAKPGSLSVSRMLDVRLCILGDTQRTVENASRLHLYHGTRDVLCKLVLLEEESLTAGESGLAQLRLMEPLATKPGDHFVVRFYSPMETVGGGTVIDSSPVRHRRRDEAVLNALRIHESGSTTDRVAQKLLEMSPRGLRGKELAVELELNEEDFDKELRSLEEQGLALRLHSGILVHTGFLEEFWTKVEKLLNQYHRQNPMLDGLRRDELPGKLLSNRDAVLVEALTAEFVQKGRLREEHGRIALRDFSVQLTPQQKRLWSEIEGTYLEAGYNVPGSEEITSAHPKEKELVRQVYEAMQANGTLVLIAPQLFYHKRHYGKALESLRSHLQEHGEITLGEFRDLLGTSRKYAVALLEHWDRRGITQKSGEARVLNKPSS